MQVTIKKLKVDDKNKDGIKLVSKNGNPFYKVGIQVSEYGEQWINGLVFETAPAWKEGDRVDLEIADQEYNGKTSKKFEIPSKKSEAKVEQLALRNEMKIMQGQLVEIIKALNMIWKKLNTEDEETSF